jgi:hypothetical protein
MQEGRGNHCKHVARGGEVVAWLKSVLAWLAAHPLPFLAALGAALAVALFRRSDQTLAKVEKEHELKAAEQAGRAEVYEEQAAALKPLQEALEEQATEQEKSLEVLEQPAKKEDVAKLSDQELVDEINRLRG